MILDLIMVDLSSARFDSQPWLSISISSSSKSGCRLNVMFSVPKVKPETAIEQVNFSLDCESHLEEASLLRLLRLASSIGLVLLQHQQLNQQRQKLQDELSGSCLSSRANEKSY